MEDIARQSVQSSVTAQGPRMLSGPVTNREEHLARFPRRCDVFVWGSRGRTGLSGPMLLRGSHGLWGFNSPLRCHLALRGSACSHARQLPCVCRAGSTKIRCRGGGEKAKHEAVQHRDSRVGPRLGSYGIGGGLGGNGRCSVLDRSQGTLGPRCVGSPLQGWRDVVGSKLLDCKGLGGDGLGSSGAAVLGRRHQGRGRLYGVERGHAHRLGEDLGGHCCGNLGEIGHQANRRSDSVEQVIAPLRRQHGNPR